MIENRIESRLKREAERLNGKAVKFVAPGMNGMPDRLLLFPVGRVYFAELKAPGKKLKPLQKKRKKQLEDLGFKVFVIDSFKAIQSALQEVKDEIQSP